MTGRCPVVQTITSPDGLASLGDNCFLGTPPTMNNARIEFAGNDNLLFCEEGVTLSGTIRFPGNHALTVLRRSSHPYRLDVSVNSDCLFYSGKNSYYNGALHAICSEGRYILLGDDCLYSFGIWIRTADPHLVYDAETKSRINPSKDVLVGDHVWIGQDAMLLKGTRIGSGSILGGRAVTSGMLCSNASWAGVPARCLREGIFWDGASVHGWSQEQTEASQFYSKQPAVFRQDERTLDLDALLSTLHSARTVDQRLELVKERLMGTSGNRFYLASGQQTKAGRTRKKGLTISRIFGA